MSVVDFDSIKDELGFCGYLTINDLASSKCSQITELKTNFKALVSVWQDFNANVDLVYPNSIGHWSTWFNKFSSALDKIESMFKYDEVFFYDCSFEATGKLKNCLSLFFDIIQTTEGVNIRMLDFYVNASLIVDDIERNIKSCTPSVK